MKNPFVSLIPLFYAIPLHNIRVDVGVLSSKNHINECDHMIEPQLAYSLFLKMYCSELLESAAIFVEEQATTIEEKRTLHVLTTSFVQFLTNQRVVDKEALHYWVQIRSQTILAHSTLFVEALSYALETVLHATQYTYRDQVLQVHETLLTQSKDFVSQWHQNSQDEPFSEQWRLQMDTFSKALIRYNGSEDLAILLKLAEETFQFKRCIFLSYHPWLDEFSGAIGADRQALERLRGKIDVEPVFSMKRAIFLKNPAPYVQPVAIEMLNLSSVIFIPIMHDQQLYGWLSFDQMGESFDCSATYLNFLQEVGNRLGMYLGRPQLRNRLNRNITLTEKEKLVLYLLLEGHSNKEIASLLYMSEFTVRDYVKMLMQKTEARNRTHLITLAFRSGLID